MENSLVRSGRLGLWSGLAVAVLVALPGLAFAAVPSVMTVHGGLFAVGGGPVADGSYKVTFSVFTGAVGGNPVYTEGPVDIAVKNGVYSYAIGSKTPLTADALANMATPFLSMKVESDPEFSRQAIASVPFSMRASLAESLDCSGCIKTSHLADDVLSPYAKSADLAAYAKSADLTVFAKAADLAKSATSGAYADLTGVPDLTVYAKSAALSKVATTGKYADLLGAPVSVAAGVGCGTGLVVQGIKANGTLDCIQANVGFIDTQYLPPDGIDEISNGLVSVQFDEIFNGKSDIPIPDNSPVGVSDTLMMPDIGIAQTLAITLELTNSDLTKLTVSAFDPNGKEYVLHNKGSSGTEIKTSFPDQSKTISGDLTTWNGKNAKGKWYIRVVDDGLLDNNIDGAVKSWGLKLKTLSNKKAAVKGDLEVTGALTVDGKLTVKGGVSGLPHAAYRWAVWSTYWEGCCWMHNDDPALFGGVNPSSWTDGAAHASSISADKTVQGTLFNKTAFARKNSNVWSESWRSYSSTNGKLAGALFRIRNNTGNDITWTPYFWYTSYSGWGEIASVTLNGEDTWASNNDCGANCSTGLDLTIPANRTSTAIFVAGSSPDTGEFRTLTLAFFNDSLVLPEGLEFIDDLDTATGGYEQ
ncbi:MAG: proprotein convertase P-domain-containing protein [Myxococcota bacterium]